MKPNSLINRGLLAVYGPVISFVITSTFITNWFTSTIFKFDISDFIVAIAFILSIFISWIWWSYKIVKWKLWAFAKIEVDDRYTLYERAIQVGLIWPRGSIFNKTEIWTEQDKENWKKLDLEIREIFET